MTNYDIKLNPKDLEGLLSEDNTMANLLTNIVNQVLEAQVNEKLNAERYQHTEERTGYRNGYRTRTLYTRVGKLNLRVPQTREGQFSTELFKRYQRNEQGLVLALMEMYVQGVSTRKVRKITEELCGVSFSKSTVSQLCTDLDARVEAWRNRSLRDKSYPFILVDALVINVRRDEAVRSTAALVAYGINAEGQREILDLLIADSETEASWQELFQRLKARGLKDVDLVVSDDHTGLVNAVKKYFQGTQWQRCQTHFMRNILGVTPRHLRSQIAAKLKFILQADSKASARMLANKLLEEFDTKAKKAMECLERGLEDALTILHYPKKYHQRLRTTNLPERNNEEIRRRERVVRIFPNEESAYRLIGSLLADINDEWLNGIRYLDMSEYHDWCKEVKNKKISETTNITVIGQ